MASGNRKRFPCGHRGFGTHCHRCEMADKLEQMAAASKRYVTRKKTNKPKTWTVEEMYGEAKRLRNEGH